MATPRGLAAMVTVVVVTGVHGGVDRGWDGARAFAGSASCLHFFPSWRKNRTGSEASLVSELPRSREGVISYSPGCRIHPRSHFFSRERGKKREALEGQEGAGRGESTTASFHPRDVDEEQCPAAWFAVSSSGGLLPGVSIVAFFVSLSLVLAWAFWCLILGGFF